MTYFTLPHRLNENEEFILNEIILFLFIFNIIISMEFRLPTFQPDIILFTHIFMSEFEILEYGGTYTLLIKY